MGIRKTPTGWQAYTNYGGQFHSKRFKPDTPLLTMKQWIKRTEARLSLNLPDPDSTFGEDVKTYLEQVATMRTYRHRKDDLSLWLKVFGPDRDRQTITSGEIRAQLELWRKTYAASTCNHRRTALMHLWTVLDGRSAVNPARDVPKYPEDVGAPRDLSPAACRWLLRYMPYSQTKARLSLMRWTGWPQGQIMRIQPQDIDWKKAVFIRARRKGKGVASTWLPLLPQAWRVLRTFKKLGAWGNFSTSSMRTSLRLAAEKITQDERIPAPIRIECEDVTPYQFRHTFGTMVASLTKDDRAVQTLLQHGDIRQTHRYTKATVDPRVAAAMARVESALKAIPKASDHATAMPDATNSTIH